MGKYLFANHATSRLKVATDAASATITLPDGDGAKFPSPTGDDFFLVTLDDRRTGQIEICKCTSRSGDILVVVRAQEGTPAQSFVAGAVASNHMTAGTLTDFQDKALEVPGYPKPEADDRFVEVTGDTMLGPLHGVTPVAPADLTRKDYVDQGLNLKSDKGHRHPTSDVIDLDTTLDNMVPEAPNDGVEYVRRSKNWWPNSGGAGGGSSITISETPPVDAVLEDLWWNNTTGQTFIRYFEEWVQIAGPLAAITADDILFIDFINLGLVANDTPISWDDVNTYFTGGIIDAGGYYSVSGNTGFFQPAAWPLFMNNAGLTIVIEYYNPLPYQMTGYGIAFDLGGDNDLTVSSQEPEGVEYYDDDGPDVGLSGLDAMGICRIAISADNATTYMGSWNGQPAQSWEMGSPAIFGTNNSVEYPDLWTGANVTGPDAGARVRFLHVVPYADANALPALSVVTTPPRPDATNSGYQTGMGTLTPTTTEIVTTADDQIIENFDSTASIHVMHKRVIVRKGKLTGSGAYAIKVDYLSGTNLHTYIEDVTIAGSYTDGIVGTLVNIFRCDISGCVNGVRMTDWRFVVRSNYIHGVQAGGSCAVVMAGACYVQDNTLINSNTTGAAFLLNDATDPGNIHADIVVYRNYLGGGAYPFIWNGSTHNWPIDNVTVMSNVFDPVGASGYVSVVSTHGADIRWLYNVDASGDPVEMP